MQEHIAGRRAALPWQSRTYNKEQKPYTSLGVRAGSMMIDDGVGER